jgi:ABC-type glycerol-3-phosphate transport system substrate-binding protein
MAGQLQETQAELTATLESISEAINATQIIKPQQFTWMTSEVDPATIEVMHSIIRDFEEEYPQYDVILKPVGPDEHAAVRAAALAAGNPPAIGGTNPAATMEFLEYLRNVDDVVARIGQENFWPGYDQYAAIEGHFYMIPLYHAAYAWYYR